MAKVALDCEMVGDRDNQAMAARVSVVDENLRILYDTFVQPERNVHYFRNTGISQSQLDGGRPFKEVQSKVLSLISGSILIGHSVDADLSVLRITYNRVKDIADHHKDWKGQRRSLKELASEILGEDVQTGPYHDSVEDARTAMKIYKKIPF